MRIMPAFGNDIGFSRKGWASINKVVAQTDPAPSEEAYWTALDALSLKSSTTSGVEADPTSEVVMSPGSPWGGKEVPTGMNYSDECELVLEGDVPVPAGESDDALNVRIAKDFVDWCTDTNRNVDGAVADLKSQLRGEADVEISAQVVSLSHNPDGTVKISLTVTISATSGEAEHERKSRMREDKADHAYDLQKDDRG